jgi:hypothetical protein
MKEIAGEGPERHQPRRSGSPISLKTALAFLLGCLAPPVAALALVTSGSFRPGALDKPSPIERAVATRSIRAAIQKHAVRSQNPFPATESNLRQGMVLFRNNCA